MNANVSGTLIPDSLWRMRSDAAVLSAAPEASGSGIRKPPEEPSANRGCNSISSDLQFYSLNGERQIPGAPPRKSGYAQQCGKPEIYRVTFCILFSMGTNSFGEIKTPDNTHSEWGDGSPCDGGWHMVHVGHCEDVGHPMGKFAYSQLKEGHPTSWFLALPRLK